MKRSQTLIAKILSCETLTLLLFILICSSCSPVLYSPTVQNVPLLKQKGEVNIEAGYSSTEDAEGFNFRMAVAIDSSLAVAASYNSLNGGTKNSTDYWYGRGNYLEAALGKFGSSKSGPLVYEAFLGLGYASVKNEKPKEFTNGQFIKPYFQPSLGVRSKFVDFAVTLRFAVVSYISDKVNVTDKVAENVANDFFENKKTTFVFEPGATLRLGVQNVKLSLQSVYSTFSYDSDDSHLYNNTIFAIGLNFYPK